MKMAEDAVLALLGRFFQHCRHTMNREEEQKARKPGI